MEALLFNRELDRQRRALARSDRQQLHHLRLRQPRRSVHRRATSSTRASTSTANVGDRWSRSPTAWSASRACAGYGNVVEIDHGNGYVTRYAHNSRLLGRVGRHRAEGAADRADRLDRPFDRPAPALRSLGARPRGQSAASSSALGHAPSARLIPAGPRAALIPARRLKYNAALPNKAPRALFFVLHPPLRPLRTRPSDAQQPAHPVFGSRNERLLKQLGASSRRSTRSNRRCRR